MPARTAALPRPLVASERHASTWTRTVAVIRIPRLHVGGWLRPAGRHAEDPLDAFATEAELRMRRPSRRR